MKKRLIDLRSEVPLLDVVSYGRGTAHPFTPAQRAQIALTVGRAPEVMVKVSGGARSLRGVAAHLAYVGREDFMVETDTGERIHGEGFQTALIKDWNLDLEVLWHQSERAIREPRRPPKLVHNIIFSMPPGTDAKKVLMAVRRFAENEWALKHRYAIVLHTNEPHPHVHAVVKAMSEQSDRLNIRKATLRDWRRRFAEHLRDLGVAANATERAVRGISKTSLPTAIYRAELRRDSTYVADRAAAVYKELRHGMALTADKGRAKMLATRRAVDAGWRDASLKLAAEGYPGLALQVQRFVHQMPPPRTDREMIARQLRRERELDRSRREERTR